ncbi:MAG TPA: lipoyl(octanoyl) transferase LipB [Thermodesulfobacteriota bacterium]|nr:lipoyl(octanoyl) transferase LipB [Thermodesulfobacteriota bacterium]
MQEFKILSLGITNYSKALDIQLKLLDKRKNNLIPDTLILLEHPPTITIGRAGNLNNLLVSEEHLKNNGIHFEKISRGGDITFHGPGQIVGYPIIDLNNLQKDIHKYLRALEYLIVDVLKKFNIKASPFKGITGVWANGKKIASIGIGVKRWITYHGFALNIDNDLEYFDMIIPCGLNKVRMTNIQNESDLQNITMEEINKYIIDSFSKTFNMNYSGTLDLKTG